MLNIGSFDGFRIFLPEAEIIPESQAMVDRIYAENRRFLENEPEKNVLRVPSPELSFTLIRRTMSAPRL